MEPGFCVLPANPAGIVEFISGLKAEHGWNNSYPAMHPALFAFGPNFIEGTNIENLHQVDIYPLMTHLLKIEPDSDIDGDLELKPWLPVLREAEVPVTYAPLPDVTTGSNSESQVLRFSFLFLLLNKLL